MNPGQPDREMFPAPMQAVSLDDGSSVELRDVYSARAVALVFLRHLGCIFCREIVTRLSAHADRNIFFVAMERAEACAEFRERMGSPHRIISDPARVLYESFGLGRGGWMQVVNPHTIARGFGNLRAGLRNGRPSADPMMLGGAFVVAAGGTVVWSYRSRDAADNPSPEGIMSALDEADAIPARSA